jgi:hypothetical protein
MANKDEKDSVEWFNDTLDEITKDRKNTFKKRVRPEVGNLYLYVYDAKTKDKLPYWDACPLVFPTDYYDDGFLGLNMHYLAPAARSKLFTALKSQFLNNDKFNMTTKLGEYRTPLAYSVLKEYGNYFYKYNECVKRYLYGHVRSSFYYVHPSQWDKVISLPLARWQYNTRK